MFAVPSPIGSGVRPCRHGQTVNGAGRRFCRPYALVEGELGDRSLVAVVGPDGSTWWCTCPTCRHKRPDGCPDARAALHDSPSRTADPLAATLAVARSFDRVMSVEILDASSRCGLGAVRARGCASPETGALPEAGVPPEMGAPPEMLTIDVSSHSGVRVVQLAGELDLASSDYLRRVLLASEGDVVVDLSRLTFLDASGLSALVAVRREAEAQERKVALTGARGLVRRVFAITELEDLLDE